LIVRLETIKSLYEKGEPQHNAIGICINEAKSLLPKEKQVIEDAYDSVQFRVFDKPEGYYNNYYNTKYNNQIK